MIIVLPWFLLLFGFQVCVLNEIGQVHLDEHIVSSQSKAAAS